mmetsp:Transcript_22039/g.16439  ORF Transcript_22039/g.16439 Transcript_22039/m.16439 type:complete len:111 (-) Transcript_22039:190-522(-)
MAASFGLLVMIPISSLLHLLWLAFTLQHVAIGLHSEQLPSISLLKPRSLALLASFTMIDFPKQLASSEPARPQLGYPTVIGSLPSFQVVIAPKLKDQFHSPARTDCHTQM